MDNKKAVGVIIDYAKQLVGEKLLTENGRLCLRCDENSMYITKSGIDFTKINEQDIVKVEFNKAEGKDLNFAAIFIARKDINAIAMTHSKYVCAVARTGATIPAVLDDMAQIVGQTCKTSKNDCKSILKTLKGRNSCLIENDGALTTGRTMAEAYTCALVLDKAATCFVCSSVMGGNKVLGMLDCKLMRFVYKTKYSKKNVENTQEREGE